ncbi:hypothetical protein V493_01967 [Pseudogymnoascus sp. VKM F-4281 (FW-2241)]|nr:hypothetical protein V493_01967 [Pseudogymnoascus sp. VKM F-4281 (FW-2241)]
MLNPPQILLINRQIQAILPKRPIGPRNPTLHPARHHQDNPYPERSELQAQRVAVGLQGALGGVVDAAEDVRGYGGDGADVDDFAAGADHEGGELADDLDDGDDVCGEGGVDV